MRYWIYHQPLQASLANSLILCQDTSYDFAFLLLLRVVFTAGVGGGTVSSGISSSSNTNFLTMIFSLISPLTGISAFSTLPSVSKRRA